MQYLINLADQGIIHDIPDLRGRVQQLLNLIPSGKAHMLFALITWLEISADFQLVFHLLYEHGYLTLKFFVKSPSEQFYDINQNI